MGLPSKGVGGNGITSEFGDLTRMTRQEVERFLKELDASVSKLIGNIYLAKTNPGMDK